MALNKRRHANAVPIASFATWLVIGLFASVAGLGYVYCKNQLHATGAQIKELEKELVELHNRNESVRANIVVLSSTKSLADRLESGFIELAPITDDSVVAVGRQAAQHDLQPVSNRSPLP